VVGFVFPLRHRAERQRGRYQPVFVVVWIMRMDIRRHLSGLNKLAQESRSAVASKQPRSSFIWRIRASLAPRALPGPGLETSSARECSARRPRKRASIRNRTTRLAWAAAEADLPPDLASG